LRMSCCSKINIVIIIYYTHAGVNNVFTALRPTRFPDIILKGVIVIYRGRRYTYEGWYRSGQSQV
jgi:hypothetical protein